MKTSIGLALVTLLSIGTITSASAAGTSVAAPPLPDASIEVIVVTAKRPAAQPAASDAIEEIVVTAKRPTKTSPDRTPPATTIVMPKLELAVAEKPVFRL